MDSCCAVDGKKEGRVSLLRAKSVWAVCSTYYLLGPLLSFMSHKYFEEKLFKENLKLYVSSAHVYTYNNGFMSQSRGAPESLKNQGEGSL